MDRSIFHQFPPAMAALVHEIEKRAETLISFAPMPHHLTQISDNKALISIIFELRQIVSIEILVPSGSTPPLHIIGHEIIHAGRTVIEEVDVLNPRDPKDAILAIAIGNDVEHLTVIPREMEHFLEAQTYWRKAFTRDLRMLWKRYSTDPFSHGIERDLLRFWLVTNKVLPDWKGIEILRDMLQYPDRHDIADRLFADVSSASEYSHLLAAVIRSQGKQPGDFCLLDRHGVARTIPVA